MRDDIRCNVYEWLANNINRRRTTEAFVDEKEVHAKTEIERNSKN